MTLYSPELTLKPIAKNDPFLQMLIDFREKEVMQNKQLLVQRNDFFIVNNKESNLTEIKESSLIMLIPSCLLAIGAIGAGITFKEITDSLRPMADEFVPGRYGVAMHGVGLCDEFPAYGKSLQKLGQ